jgi:hypothetical protein
VAKMGDRQEQHLSLVATCSTTAAVVADKHVSEEGWSLSIGSAWQASKSNTAEYCTTCNQHSAPTDPVVHGLVGEASILKANKHATDFLHKPRTK